MSDGQLINGQFSEVIGETDGRLVAHAPGRNPRHPRRARNAPPPGHEPASRCPAVAALRRGEPVAARRGTFAGRSPARSTP